MQARATRQELIAAHDAYDAARAATVGVHDLESSPQWEALGAAYDHLRAVQKSFHARRAVAESATAQAL